MLRQKFVLISLSLILLFVSACSPRIAQSNVGTSPQSIVQSAAFPSSAIPVTAKGPMIKLAWFYKPPARTDLNATKSYFDLFILTKNDEQTGQVFQKREGGAQIMEYLRFEAIMHPSSCTVQPWQNQVAYQPGDYCMISRDHPDWFLLDSNGKRIETADGFVRMDPGSVGWRAFFLDRVKKMQAEYGWYGVFLDNVEASLGQYHSRGTTLQNYPDDASYQTAVKGFLKYLYLNYFEPEHRPLGANILNIGDFSVWFAYLHYLDMGMDENFSLGWSNGYLSASDWQDELNRAIITQALDKQIVLVSQGSENDSQRQQFAFASYLLISANGAFFRYASSKNYNDVWVYPNYELDLRDPKGPMYPKGDQWCRNFANGQVCVNPNTHRSTIIKN